ncbi:MAG TPA: hypothetical protein VK918_01845 [Pyrinomonadaceae bacterium]|nr:hypothetical protein [Pyrinomonadaceae bacterium]
MNKVSADPQAHSSSTPPVQGFPDSNSDSRSGSGRRYLIAEDSNNDIPLRVDGGAPFADALAWADQLLAALEHLHGSNPPTMHRHLRPANIRVADDGSIRLIFDGSSDTELESDDFAYSPLEQIWEHLDPASQKVIINSFDDQAEADLQAPLDARSDLYSMAATLYHVITGRKPADALERSIEFLDGNPDPLPRPDKIDSGIPQAIADVLMKALNVKRGDRYDSASAMRAALTEAAPQTAAPHAASDENPLLKKQQEIAAEQLRTAELEKRLREAEEQRLLAEQRAAEAERLLRVNEQSAAPIEAAVPASFADSPKEQSPAASMDFDSVLILEPDGGDTTAKYVDPEPIISMADPVPVARNVDNDEVHYALAAEQPGSSKMMFVVAGGVTAILLAAAVGWFTVFSGNKAPAAEVQPAPAVEQPAPAQPEPLQVAVETEDAVTTDGTVTESEVPGEASQTAAASARPAARTQDRAATAAKPPPAKPTPEKKKVTVDDLISDH